MKITFSKMGQLCAHPQSTADVKLLMSFVQNPEEATKRIYKKQYKKPCEVCGKKCKGKLGMAVHMRMKHAEVAI